MLAVLANVTNAPASAGTTKEPKVYRGRTRAPWYNKSLTKDMYFRLQAFDEMQVKYDLMKAAYHEMKEKLEKSEQANVSLALAIADYAERLSQVQ